MSKITEIYERYRAGEKFKTVTELLDEKPIDNFLKKLRELGYHAERNGDVITMDCPTYADIETALYKQEGMINHEKIISHY
ncbi:hypothetical protein [Peribacillus asahii]|uniref:hypothetical protein n=1 Tax=Peribacillus asahii TaxID=228899 RepID=UPI00207AF908|nr:hypothetical protein [Peribacillus asahii]USK85706.1 hypothetical protein LIT35_03300 [Peribacillus asahii]